MHQGFLRTLHVGLDDERQRLHALAQLVKHILELGRLLFGQLDVAELALPEQRDLASLAFVRKHDDLFTGQRHLGQALNLDWNGRTRFLNRLAVFIEHGAHTAICGACQHDIAPTQGTALHQHRSDRPTPFIQARFDDQSLGRGFTRRVQLENLGLQQDVLKQLINPLASLCRNRNEGCITAILFGNHLMAHQFLLQALRVCL